MIKLTDLPVDVLGIILDFICDFPKMVYYNIEKILDILITISNLLQTSKILYVNITQNSRLSDKMNIINNNITDVLNMVYIEESHHKLKKYVFDDKIHNYISRIERILFCKYLCHNIQIKNKFINGILYIKNDTDTFYCQHWSSITNISNIYINAENLFDRRNKIYIEKIAPILTNNLYLILDSNIDTCDYRHIYLNDGNNITITPNKYFVVQPAFSTSNEVHREQMGYGVQQSKQYFIDSDKINVIINNLSIINVNIVFKNVKLQLKKLILINCNLDDKQFCRILSLLNKSCGHIEVKHNNIHNLYDITNEIKEINLKFLDLSHNQLEHRNSIILDINFIGLEYLDLSFNKLKFFNIEGCLSLKYLALNDNKIEKKPWMENMINLEIYNFYNNPFKYKIYNINLLDKHELKMMSVPFVKLNLEKSQIDFE